MQASHSVIIFLFIYSPVNVRVRVSNAENSNKSTVADETKVGNHCLQCSLIPTATYPLELNACAFEGP